MNIIQHIQQSQAIVDSYRALKPVTFDEVARLVEKYTKVERITISEIKPRHKRELLALAMLFFHPEKLTGTHLRRLRNGIISGLSEILGTPPNYFKNYLQDIIFQYAQYKDFKGRVDALFQKISIIVC